MRVFFSDVQFRHAPQQFMVRGRIVRPVETPERARRLRDRVQSLGLAITEPFDRGSEPLLSAHDPAYLAFLETAHERFSALSGAGDEVLPNVHPYAGADTEFAGRGRPRSTDVVGQAGWYLGDLAVAVGACTFAAAKASAQSAIAAAEAVVDGAGEAFALCRPPGHHAYRDRASGFCYLNNAALAAEVLRKHFDKVAILDFDTHHGDGTQAIFYRRADVFFASVHTDPSAYYPFFTGYREERGAGPGEGQNLNIPLAPGSDDDAFVTANREMVVAALASGAEALVISAGWDAHQDDPLSRLAVTTTAFRVLGALYGEVPLPTVIVQEGGYSLAAVDEVVPAFLAAFLDERRTP